MTADWDRARAVADAVLYEGYLLYPYRANSSKNQTRWQFGVLGPRAPPTPGSARTTRCPRRSSSRRRRTRRCRSWCASCSCSTAASRRTWAAADSNRSTSWCRDRSRGCAGTRPSNGRSRSGRSTSNRTCRRHLPIEVDAGTDIETVDGGRLVRTRRALHAQLEITAERDDGFVRLTMAVRNTARARRRQGRRDRRVADRHPPRRRDHRRRLRVAARTTGIGRQRRRPMPAPPLLPGAGRTARATTR